MARHPTAIIDPSSRVAADVEIGPYAVIGPEADIASGCRIGAHTVIEFTTLGPNCQVFPLATLGLPPQHLRYQGEKTRLVVGSGTVFREGVTAHRGTAFDAGATTIGDNGYFMAYSHVAHDCRVGNNVTLANGALLAGHVQVGDNSFVSGGVAIHQFVRVGKGAIISGGAMVVQDVAPFCVAQGDRATLRGLNLVGMRRLGFDRDSIRLVRAAYKAVFASGLRLEEALDRPELLVENPNVKTFRAFFTEPKRGFTRPAAENAVEEEVLS